MKIRARRRLAHWLRAVAYWLSPDKVKITVRVTGAREAADAIERARLAIGKVSFEMRP